MKAGTRVTVEFGIPTPQTAAAVVVGPGRRPGTVEVRSLADPTIRFFAAERALTVVDTTPPHRATDPATSRAAGRRTPEQLSRGQWLVLNALAAVGRAGLTDFDYLVRNGLKQTSAGKRRLELERAGYCTPTGATRPSDSGDPAGVHRITDLGLEVWRHETERRGAA